jgi:hypothetical protein
MVWNGMRNPDLEMEMEMEKFGTESGFDSVLILQSRGFFAVPLVVVMTLFSNHAHSLKEYGLPGSHRGIW